jgi:hypothetical protein
VFDSPPLEGLGWGKETGTLGGEKVKRGLGVM